MLPAVAGLAVANPVALTSTHDDGPGELLAGTASGAEGPLLLPPAFVAELERRPRGVPVRLGAHDALAYRKLRHRRSGGALSAFVVPTDRGAVTIACLANDELSETLSRCEQVATTLTLRGVKALPLGPDPRTTAAVKRILDRLNARRARERRALRAARAPGSQAAAATRVAAAYSAAARSLDAVRPGPVERPAHRALLAGLQRAKRAYEALGAAARSGNTRGYRFASIRIGRAEAAVDRAARASG
jgi:hypothetical protein